MSSYKKKVEQSWDKISSKYDEAVRANPRIMQSYNRLFETISIPKNPIVLDIGCGTGISTFELAEKCNREGLFYGIDLSKKMIEKAEQIASEIGYDNCVFSQGDAEELDYSDTTFDLVISCYTFHLIPDKLKALFEIFRVLKPGGTFALLYHGEHQINEVFTLFRDFEDKYPEWFKDYNWDLVRSVFISLEKSHELFTQAGFENIQLYAIDEIDFVEPSSFVARLEYVSSFWQRELAMDVLLSLKNEMVEEMEKKSIEYGIKLTSYNIYAHGAKPM